jgi:hypothetical protein
MNFTKANLSALPLAESGQYAVTDDKSRLKLRVGTKRKVFFIQIRVNGHPKTITIGKFPDWSVKAAKRKS